jgi:hypothetical protein
MTRNKRFEKIGELARNYVVPLDPTTDPPVMLRDVVEQPVAGFNAATCEVVGDVANPGDKLA